MNTTFKTRIRHTSEETACGWCGSPLYVRDIVTITIDGEDTCSDRCAALLEHKRETEEEAQCAS